MPNIVILGSCRYEPYKILAMPNKLDPKLYKKDHEKAYEHACGVFYPAIDESDFVVVFAPDGIGEHTKADMDYAKKQKKPVIVVDRKALIVTSKLQEKKMTKRKHYIDFKVIVPFIHNTKRVTVTCAVISLSSRERIGIIQWYAPWRQYCFYPNFETIWNGGCLEDVQSFLRGLNFAQRHKKDLEKALVSQYDVYSDIEGKQ